MNVCCVICSDLLQPSDDVFYTPCGHVFHFACVTQWLERSKSCPQCREKVTQSKIHRIYFNFSNNETIVEDATTLQASVDSLKFQVLVKDREVKQTLTKNETLKKETSGLRAEVRKLESQLLERDTAMYAFKEQLKYFKDLSSVSENAKKEVTRLKKKLEELRSVQILVDSAGDEVDEMIRNTRDVSTLLTYVAVMKRELSTSVTKRREMRDAMKKLQLDLTAVSRERNFLAEEHTLRKQFEEELAVAESRIRAKNDRIKELEEMLPQSQRSTNIDADESGTTEVAKRSEHLNPEIQSSRERNHRLGKQTDSKDKTKARDPTWKIVDLRESSPIIASGKARKRSATDSDFVDLTEGTSETDKSCGNEENSPYLSYKTCPGGVMGTLKPKLKIPSGLSANSILVKKPRLAQSSRPQAEIWDPDCAYDGYGGHSKPDKFPSPIRGSQPKKSHRGPRQRSAKLDDGKNKKLTDFVNNE